MLGNKKPILIILALLVVLLAGAIFITLQNDNPSEERGNITGYIVDAANLSPVRGVTVIGKDQDGTQYKSHENADTTGADGFFSLALPPNDYTLIIEAEGYQPFESSAVYTVKDGDTMEIQESFRLVAADPAETGTDADNLPEDPSPDFSPAGGQTPPVEPAADGTVPGGSPVEGTGTQADSGIQGGDPGDSIAEGTVENVGLATVLTFSDPALEKAVRQEMHLDANQQLTSDDASEVKKLDLSGGGKDEQDKITDLTGLRAFSNLEELSLQSNRVTNIAELAALKKLKKLQLEGNQISDLTPLQELDSLRKLEVASNDITDISPLYSLKHLELLDVINNKITSIQGIGSMVKLHTLRLGRNRITDISPLAELPDLTHLGFGYNKVKDISALYNLPMLHVLTMNGNQIKDISPVAYMPELYWLEVAGNPIEDTSILDDLSDSIKHLER